jgi:RNA polymerase sigma factor (sigma-70 family)
VHTNDFTEFFRREMGPLVAFVRRAGYTMEHAKDAAQEAMTRAYVEWSSLEQPRAWVRTTAIRYAAADKTRTYDGVLRAVAGGWSVSAHTDPEVALQGYEQEQLLKSLGALPPKQRLVMAWHLDGFSNFEISEQLDMAPNTVRSNFRHAREALKTAYLARKH